MNSQSDPFNAIISERLKFIDTLLKGGRVEEAAKEIAEIRTVDSTNPYALAYEERIKTMKASTSLQANPAPVTSVERLMPHQVVTTSQESTHTHPQRVIVDMSPVANEAFTHCAESPSSESVNSTAVDRVPGNRSREGKASVVLVDDDELLLTALVELFRDNGYTAHYFTKAEDALQFLKGHAPDLVLCDVNLSKSAYGGFSLLQKIEKLGHLHRVPFIFMSGLSDEVIVRAGKEAGADDYLVKPIEPDMLLAVVKGKLRKYRQMQRDHTE